MEPIVPLDAMEQIAAGIDHAEGICQTPDGTLYVSGEKGQIYRIGVDGAATEVTSTGGWTLGLASDGEGRIYACDPPNGAVMRWTPGGGVPPEPWTRGAPDAPLATPNWGAFGPDGTYYVTESGSWKARDGRILAVGSDDEVLRYRGPDTRVVDLHGQLVLPGFHDTHVHPVTGGIELGKPCGPSTHT